MNADTPSVLKAAAERVRQLQAPVAAPVRATRAEPVAGNLAARFLGRGPAPWVWGFGALVAAGAWLAVSAHDQRLREEDQLLYTGAEIRDAIASYYARDSHGRHELPRSWRDLVEDRRDGEVRRHLDREPEDPITRHKDWVFERRADQGIVGVHSASLLTPSGGRAYAPEFASFAGAARYAEWVFKFEPGLAAGPRAAYADAPGRDSARADVATAVARTVERTARRDVAAVYEQRTQRRRGRSRPALSRVLLVWLPPTPHLLFPFEPTAARAEGWQPAAAFAGTAMALPGSGVPGTTFAVSNSPSVADDLGDAARGAFASPLSGVPAPAVAAPPISSETAVKRTVTESGYASFGSAADRNVVRTVHAADGGANVARTSPSTAPSTILAHAAPKVAVTPSPASADAVAATPAVASTAPSVVADPLPRALSDAAPHAGDKPHAQPEVSVSREGETIVLAYSGPIGPGTVQDASERALAAQDDGPATERSSTAFPPAPDVPIDRSAAKPVRRGGKDSAPKMADNTASTPAVTYTERAQADVPGNDSPAPTPNARPAAARCDAQAAADRVACARMFRLHGADASSECLASVALRIEQCQSGEALGSLAIRYD